MVTYILYLLLFPLNINYFTSITVKITDYCRRPGQGQILCTSVRDERFLKQSALRTRSGSDSALRNYFETKYEMS